MKEATATENCLVWSVTTSAWTDVRHGNRSAKTHETNYCEVDETSLSTERLVWQLNNFPTNVQKVVWSSTILNQWPYEHAQRKATTGGHGWNQQTEEAVHFYSQHLARQWSHSPLNHHGLLRQDTADRTVNFLSCCHFRRNNCPQKTDMFM